MRIRRHLSYANVVATLALLLALGGGAYAIDKVTSREIVNGTIRSVDLKNRKGVHAADVKRNALHGGQIDEATLDASRFAPIAGDESVDCDPTSAVTFVNCASASFRLNTRSHVLIIATGNEDTVSGTTAAASCRIRVDGVAEGLAVSRVSRVSITRRALPPTASRGQS